MGSAGSCVFSSRQQQSNCNFGNSQDGKDQFESYNNRAGRTKQFDSWQSLRRQFCKWASYLLLLRPGRVLAAMGGGFTYSFVIISFEGTIPLFIKETFHWDSTRAVLIFFSWIILDFLEPIAGKALDRLCRAFSGPLSGVFFSPCLL